jgi:cyclopropane fatty-acyl-phospholipid synthase-like methyltransferase
MSHDILVKHYQSLLAEHGDSSRSLQHFDRASQFRRFELLTSHIAGSDFTLLDVGCGLGHMLDYLNESGHLPSAYLGIDIVPEFIELAKKRHDSFANANFRKQDIQTDSMTTTFDHVAICGIFNNVLPDNWEFIFETLRKSFEVARLSLSFNLLSTYVDYQDPTLFYADPLRVFDFCKKNLSRKIDLHNSYVLKEGSIPYEYTITVYR